MKKYLKGFRNLQTVIVVSVLVVSGFFYAYETTYAASIYIQGYIVPGLNPESAKWVGYLQNRRFNTSTFPNKINLSLNTNCNNLVEEKFSFDINKSDIKKSVLEIHKEFPKNILNRKKPTVTSTFIISNPLNNSVLYAGRVQVPNCVPDGTMPMQPYNLNLLSVTSDNSESEDSVSSFKWRYTTKLKHNLPLLVRLKIECQDDIVTIRPRFEFDVPAGTNDYVFTDSVQNKVITDSKGEISYQVLNKNDNNTVLFEGRTKGPICKSLPVDQKYKMTLQKVVPSDSSANPSLSKSTRYDWIVNTTDLTTKSLTFTVLSNYKNIIPLGDQRFMWKLANQIDNKVVSQNIENKYVDQQTNPDVEFNVKTDGGTVIYTGKTKGPVCK